MAVLTPIRVPAAWRRTTAMWACVAVFALAATPAFAASIAKLSDQQLVRAADRIVEGRVVDVRSEWNSNHTQIHTTITIQTDSVLKGAAPTNGVLVFRQLGGQVGDTVMDVSDQAVFTVGEDVILFLRDGEAPLTPLVGWSQGKLTVAVNPTTGARTVRERGVSRDAFVSDVSRMVIELERGPQR